MAGNSFPFRITWVEEEGEVAYVNAEHRPSQILEHIKHLKKCLVRPFNQKQQDGWWQRLTGLLPIPDDLTPGVDNAFQTPS